MCAYLFVMAEQGVAPDCPKCVSCVSAILRYKDGYGTELIFAFWQKRDNRATAPVEGTAKLTPSPVSERSTTFEDLLTPMPRTLHESRVDEAWVDFNGHMNVAYYAILFDHALDHFFEIVGLGHEYTRTVGGSMFVVESHFTYQREVMAGDPLAVKFQLLDHDRKRIHCFMELYQTREDFLAATSEQISMHVDMAERKSTSMPADGSERLRQILDAHSRIARPKEVGHKIGIRRKPALSVPIV